MVFHNWNLLYVKEVLKNEFEGSVQNIDNDQIVWEGSGSLEVKIEVMKEDEDFLGDEKTYTMPEMEIDHTPVHNNVQILIETLDSLEALSSDLKEGKEYSRLKQASKLNYSEEAI